MSHDELPRSRQGKFAVRVCRLMVTSLLQNVSRFDGVVIRPENPIVYPLLTGPNATGRSRFREKAPRESRDYNPPPPYAGLGLASRMVRGTVNGLPDNWPA
jgi:hypothetical protein